nr:type I-E CRISPR-associated protein Cas6/Cse3/CasE [Actinopolymorpha cephalotaxi]
MTSPQAMHAAVLNGFPSRQDHADGRVLWRLDRSGAHEVLLYISSPTAPDLTHLMEQAGWPTIQTWQTRPYDKFLATLERGQHWAFRLTANPARSGTKPRPDTTKEKPAEQPDPKAGADQSEGKNRSSQRFGHVTVSQQHDWLLQRAERNGFRVLLGTMDEPDVIIRERSTLNFQRNGSRVTIRQATYDGRLEVVDPDALRRVMMSGLGHGKAYGCGLLTVAPTE